MTDVEALNFLIARFEKPTAAASALGVSDQTFWNWRSRERISAEKRPLVWSTINDHGGNLPREWLLIERAA